jgi:hypothetical protein
MYVTQAPDWVLFKWADFIKSIRAWRAFYLLLYELEKKRVDPEILRAFEETINHLEMLDVG